MIDLPREVFANDDLSASDFNKIVRALRAILPIEGPGVSMKRTPNGTVFSAKTASASPSSSPSPKPWTFAVEREGDEFTARWRGMKVQYGYQIISLDANNGNPSPDSSMALESGGVESWSATTLDNLAGDVAGHHWLKANLKAGEYSIVVTQEGSAQPQQDYINSIVYVWLGLVSAEKDQENHVTGFSQTDGIYAIPVLYKYV